MRQEEHEEILKEIETKNAQALATLQGQIEEKEAALKAKDEEIEALKSKISELEKASKGEEPKKGRKVQYLGLITSIYHDGKKIPEGTAKDDVPKELQEKFEKYFKILEK